MARNLAHEQFTALCDASCNPEDGETGICVLIYYTYMETVGPQHHVLLVQDCQKFRCRTSANAEACGRELAAKLLVNHHTDLMRARQEQVGLPTVDRVSVKIMNDNRQLYEPVDPASLLAFYGRQIAMKFGTELVFEWIWRRDPFFQPVDAEARDCMRKQIPTEVKQTLFPLPEWCPIRRAPR